MQAVSLKEQIRDYILRADNVTFAELCNRFGERFHGGDMEMSIADKNVIVWSAMTEEGVKAINELLDAKIVRIEPCHVLTYFIDGRVPRLPVVKRAQAYKKPHWLPVVLRPAEPKMKQRTR